LSCYEAVWPCLETHASALTQGGDCAMLGGEKNVYQLEAERKARLQQLAREMAIQEDIENTHAQWEKLSVHQQLIHYAGAGVLDEVSRLLGEGVPVNCRG